MSNVWHGERILLRAIEPEDWPLFRSDGTQNFDDARLYDDLAGSVSIPVDALDDIERVFHCAPRHSRRDK